MPKSHPGVLAQLPHQAAAQRLNRKYARFVADCGLKCQATQFGKNAARKALCDCSRNQSSGSIHSSLLKD